MSKIKPLPWSTFDAFVTILSFMVITITTQIYTEQFKGDTISSVIGLIVYSLASPFIITAIVHYLIDFIWRLLQALYGDK